MRTSYIRSYNKKSAQNRLLAAAVLIAFSLFLLRRSASQEMPRATRDGQRISIESLGLTFEIPEEWVDWYDKYSNNLHLTVSELEKVKEGVGEWDAEYSKVINNTLPFEHCVAHIGEEGWGYESVSCSDIQMRVYILDNNLDEVEKMIEQQGVGTITEITGEKATVDREINGMWRKSVLTFERVYDDYQGTGQIEFYLRSCTNQTVAFVFMYSGSPFQQATIADILDSFQCR